MGIATDICNVLMLDNRQDWLESRRRFIGSSDVAAIFGEGYADQSPISVWDSKVNGTRGDRDDERLWIGFELQPSLCRIFSRFTGVSCASPGDYAIHYRDDISWMGASLDAVADHPDFGPIPLELKNISWLQSKEWREGGAPLKFLVQVNYQMAVTGSSHAYLFGLVGGNEPYSLLIERNDRFIETMIARLAEFWDYVERREMPTVDRFPVDNYAATNTFLSKLWPDDNGASVPMPPEADEWIQQREDAKAAIKDAEKLVDEAEAKIKAALGEATVGLFPCGSCVTWKTQHRKEYVVKASSSRVLRHKAS